MSNALSKSESHSDGPVVVKIGGAASSEEDTLIDDLVFLQKKGDSVVVVHGGGNVVSLWQKVHGIESRFIQGLRVTDAAGLEVVVAVLAGLVNKQLVSSIQSKGGKAVGLSGVDGNTIQADITNPELGYVGQIKDVSTELLENLVGLGYIPVVSPISIQRGARAAECGGLLNVNADTVAVETALALRARHLIYLTDVPGVKDREGRVVSNLSREEADKLIAGGIIEGGMIPKVEACLKASQASIQAHVLDGRKPNTLLKALEDGGTGTRFI